MAIFTIKAHKTDQESKQMQNFKYSMQGAGIALLIILAYMGLIDLLDKYAIIQRIICGV